MPEDNGAGANEQASGAPQVDAGTVFFVLGVIALIGCVVTRSVRLGGVAMVLLVPGAAMLYQVGKSLS
jgi:hypothetical protein